MAANASATGLATEIVSNEEQIRQRAYEIYLRRGDRPGSLSKIGLKPKKRLSAADGSPAAPSTPLPESERETTKKQPEPKAGTHSSTRSSCRPSKINIA